MFKVKENFKHHCTVVPSLSGAKLHSVKNLIHKNKKNKLKSKLTKNNIVGKIKRKTFLSYFHFQLT